MYATTHSQAGQLLIGGFEGTTVTQQASDLITKHHVGLMILSSRNFATAAQTQLLILELQRLAHDSGYTYPLLFAIDQEGGMMNLLFDEENITQFPGAMALAATGSEDLVYDVCKAIAVELKSIGFNLILGPVLDVVTAMGNHLIGVRSFSSTVEEVVKYGAAAARGLRAGGMMTAGKHFPGIGSAAVDSVLELPMMPESLAQIEGANAVPFARLIEAGLLDAVSVAGCAVPNISPEETHACLSPVVINQLLRGKLRFNGVVISECLEMDALYRNYGLSQGVIMAIFAGCDLVMVCHDYTLQEEALTLISKAMMYGNLAPGMFRRALERVEALQRQLPPWEQVSQPLTLSPEARLAHQVLSQLAYQKSVTLVRDYNNCLPLDKFLEAPAVPETDRLDILLLTPLLDPLYTLKPGADVTPDAYRGEEVFQAFGLLLSQYNYNVTHTTYTANGLTSLHESLLMRARVVIVATAESSRYMFQIGIVKHISILCSATPPKPLVLLAVSSPYDFYYNRNIGSVYISSYEYTENALAQVPGILFGEREARGSIPGEGRNRLRKVNRLWLVDDFDVQRDWPGVKKLWRDEFAGDGDETLFAPPGNPVLFFRWMFLLLSSTAAVQKHFVVRNSSMNTVLGVCFVWVNAVSCTGNIHCILVDKARRHQSIGKNLHARAMRYLTQERGVTRVYLGAAFPLVIIPSSAAHRLHQTLQNLNGWDSGAVVPFLRAVGWSLTSGATNYPQYVMKMDNLQDWLVPKKIFRELMIVGVQFDICRDVTQLLPLIRDHYSNPFGVELYQEAYRHLNKGVQIIVALEPAAQGVVGGIILFTNKSALTKYYPFLEELSPAGMGTPPTVGGIAGQFIDLAYSNLTEVFNFGLICTAIRYFKAQAVSQCAICGINEKQVSGVTEFGFSPWKTYFDQYEVKTFK
ncbi:glycoside hydrolase family 3 protein [Babjeviella inositovora NRRL Y-12698]|uniref:Glycoside hydrolase family 3 protein n=1 Tax=Babjeviella inositovora NRRL Y-12698 TaxID=984486 RepID=A0A1E3QYW7_9ASCO|nr:glycoside hydrolase family 3 protein [Babjeviella inositovora NRRL Y-12698]ODQ82287.1 glycoside hydrolase family 3 protein [Babjeviella inositovora NRRL Y-12698]